MYYFYFGYDDSGNRNFDSEYNKVVEHYRNSPYSSYAEENTYPENSDYRNFNPGKQNEVKDRIRHM